MVMMTEYEKAIEFLKVGCGCGCSSKVPKEAFAEMCEAFQALSKLEQDIFLMAMDGGSISSSAVLRRKFALILYIAEIAILLFVRKPI